MLLSRPQETDTQRQKIKGTNTDSKDSYVSQMKNNLYLLLNKISYKLFISVKKTKIQNLTQSEHSKYYYYMSQNKNVKHAKSHIHKTCPEIQV